MGLRNVHERVINAPAEHVGTLLDRLGHEDDAMWPATAWLPLRLDRPLSVGADGGHGPIRYWVSAYEPGRRVRFTFHPETGFDGYHEFAVDPDGPNRCVARHVTEASTRGGMSFVASVAVRPLHDAVVEDLLDNAEFAATGELRRQARWPALTRWLWRRTELGSPRRVPPPAGAQLVHAALDVVDVTDAWQVDLLPGSPRNPTAWINTTFFEPPTWVTVLLVARNILVRLIGVDTADRDVFNPVATTADETLIGADGRQFDFRASALVESDTLTLTTVARAHNRRGRAYLRLAWLFHPFVVRAMLRRATNRLAERAHQHRFASGSEPGWSAAWSPSADSPQAKGAAPTTAARQAENPRAGGRR